MSVFVGRTKEIADAIAVLTDFDNGDIDEGVVWDVVGVHGAGKSTFLKRVREEAVVLERSKRPAILAVDMSQRGLGDGFRGDYGPNAGAAVLWETFVRSRELMLECADYLTEKLRCKDFDEFRLVCEQRGKKGDEFIAAHHLRGEAGRASPASVAEQAVRTRIRELQKAVDDAFLAAWEEFTARRKVLVTVDPFDGVAPNEMGHWLVRLMLRLPMTLTLLARVPSDVELGGGHPRMRRLELPYFTIDEVGEYLRQRFRDEQLHPGIPQAVYDYTDGHPGGTELAATLIREKGSDIDARELRRILDRLPDDPERRWGKIVHDIVDAVHDPVLPKAVDAAAVTRSFDESLLAALLGVDDEEQGAGDAVSALEKHRLARPIRDGVRRDRFRLVEFIRLSLAADVRVSRSTKWKRLHERAADYYFNLLQKEEAEYPGGTYGQWYRYELPDWQANKQDWLHHSGLLPENRELTRARFVLVFLEAFWWWSCYQKFPFNQRLLEDWERATASWAVGSSDSELVKDRQLAEALWFVLDNYPLGYIKPPTAPWDEIKSKLQLVQRLCGLASDLWGDADKRRQLARARAMIRVFVAHTRRFRDPADPAADRYYGKALGTFQKLGDDWVVAWLRFETADLAIERGQAEQAVSLVGESAALTRRFTLADEGEGGEGEDAAEFEDEDAISGGWDYELLANLHRARADAHWMRGEIDQAAVEYGRAVADAYWFQGEPHAPDAYTRQFYEEITTRAAERVLALAEDGDARALQFAVSVGAMPWSGPAPDPTTAFETGRVADVRAAVFPRGPDPATELRKDGTPFMTEWGNRWEDRSDPAEQLAVLIGEEDAT